MKKLFMLRSHLPVATSKEIFAFRVTDGNKVSLLYELLEAGSVVTHTKLQKVSDEVKYIFQTPHGAALFLVLVWFECLYSCERRNIDPTPVTYNDKKLVKMHLTSSKKMNFAIPGLPKTK